MHAGYADSRHTTARRTAILVESVGRRRSGEVNSTTPFFKKDDRIRKILSKALNEATDPLGSYLEELDSDHFEKLINAFRPHEVPKDAFIIVQGHLVANDKPGLFVLEEGKLEALKADKYEEKSVQIYREPGSIFGELAVLHQGQRAATVVARTDAVIWSVSRQTVFKIVTAFQEAKRKYYDEKLMSVDLLRPLGKEARQQVIDCLRTRCYEADATIIQEGDEGHEFFLLIEGEAVASKDGHIVRTYVPGDYFGELALLSASPRAASVMAVTECTLAVIAEKDFRRLLGPLAEFHNPADRPAARQSLPRHSRSSEGEQARVSVGGRERRDSHKSYEGDYANSRGSYSTARKTRTSFR